MKTSVKKISATILMMALGLSAVFAGNTDNRDDKNKGKEKVAESANFKYAVYPVIDSQKIRLNFEQDGTAKVVVKIYDNNGAIIYTDIVKNSENLKRNYDLKKYGKGEYTIVIKTGNFEVSQKVTVGKI